MEREKKKMKEKKDRSSSPAALARGSQPNSLVRRTPGTAKISSRTSPAKPKLKTNTSSKSPEKEPPKSKSFMIVGIGASAGGLEAFAQLLRNLPADTSMAFVLVQHLDPKHESVLTELLSRRTNIQVNEVKDGMAVEPDRVYVMPPNTDMTILQTFDAQTADPAPHGYWEN